MARGSIVKRAGPRGTRWAIRFIDQDGQRRYKTVGGRKVDAEKELALVLNQVNRGEYREPRNVTLSEFADKWLRARAADVRPKTLAGYRQHLEGQVIPYFGKRRRLRHIDREDVEGFKADLVATSMSGATVGKHLLTLKMLLKTAVAWEYLARNPAEFVKPPSRTDPELTVLSPDELERLIQATDAKHRCLVMTACYSGLRQGELLGLQWGDVSFDACRLYVRRTLQQGRFYEPKSAASRRSVTVPSVVIKALKEYQLRQSVELETNELEMVFPNTRGQPMEAKNLVHRIFEPALKRASLPHVRWHDLRHGYASALISAGQNIKWVQKQLGHSSIKITMDVYGHLLPDAERDAVAKLEAALVPKIARLA